MEYKNSEIKIEQLVTYLSNKKINLTPAFQRGHVWNIGMRKKLIQNMLAKKPIPAIFLYKEAAGTTYYYNILDGKQRVESIILFIGNERMDLKIDNWRNYFFRTVDSASAHFQVNMNNQKKTFRELDESSVRDFSEYVIPVIEITLDENVTLDEIITLFVDINQQGVAVKRFDIVKAMYKNDKILKSSFRLIAIEQKRAQDIFYKMISNEFTYILKKLSTVEKTPDSNSKVDKIWEKFLEIVIFSISNQHQKPIDILKGFISNTITGRYKLTKKTERQLRKVFRFLKFAYSDVQISNAKLAKDYTHFYTMVTTLISTDLLRKFTEPQLKKKLRPLSAIINNEKDKTKNISQKKIRNYIELASKHTTDTVRRQSRNKLFYEMITSIK